MSGKERSEIDGTTTGTEEQPSIEAVLGEVAQASHHLAVFFQAAKDGQLSGANFRDILWAAEHLMVAAAGASALQDQKDSGDEPSLQRRYC